MSIISKTVFFFFGFFLTISFIPSNAGISSSSTSAANPIALSCSDSEGRLFIASINPGPAEGSRASIALLWLFAAFDSPNYPALVKAGIDTEIRTKLIQKPSGLFQVLSDFDDQVMVIRLFPGMGVDGLDYLCKTNIKGFIIQAFGMGNVPNEDKSIIPFIEKATKAGKLVAISSQSPQGMVDLTRYETANQAEKAGALSCRDMTIETSIVKMMFLFGQFQNVEAVRSNFQKSLAGEIGE